MTDLHRDKSDSARPSTVGALVYMLFGLIVWVVQFAVIYMAHTLVCTSGAPSGTASAFFLVVSVATAVALLVGLLFGNKLARMLGVVESAQGRMTYDAVFRLLAILSIVAIVWSGGTIFIVTAC